MNAKKIQNKVIISKKVRCVDESGAFKNMVGQIYASDVFVVVHIPCIICMLP